MGTIEGTLKRLQGHKVYLDTNVFIYFLDRNPDYFRLVAPVIEAVEAGLIIALETLPLLKYWSNPINPEI